MSDHEHNVQERTRSKYSLSTVDIYAERVSRPFRKIPQCVVRKAALTSLSLYVSYLLLLSISLINEYFFLVQGNRGNRYHAYYIIVPSFIFTSLPPSLNPRTRLYNREMSINAAFSIVQYPYKFIREE